MVLQILSADYPDIDFYPVHQVISKYSLKKLLGYCKQIIREKSLILQSINCAFLKNLIIQKPNSHGFHFSKTYFASYSLLCHILRAEYGFICNFTKTIHFPHFPQCLLSMIHSELRSQSNCGSKNVRIRLYPQHIIFYSQN